MIMENPQCLICAGILSIQGNNIRSHYQTAHEGNTKCAGEWISETGIANILEKIH